MKQDTQFAMDSTFAAKAFDKLLHISNNPAFNIVFLDLLIQKASQRRAQEINLFIESERE